MKGIKTRAKGQKPKRPAPPREREQWLAMIEPGFEKLSEMIEELESRKLVEESLGNDRDFELESFDVDYSEALAYVRAVFRLAGCGHKVIWDLLSLVQRNRLKGKARQEREARAEGLRDRAPESGGE